MKKIIAVLSLVLLMTGVTFASFPVQKETKTEQTANQTVNGEFAAEMTELEALNAFKSEMKSDAASNKKLDDTLIMVLLWLFLGGLAAHRWYAGKPAGWNILFILTGGGCGIWAIVDLINILTGNFD
jgi:flagellar basal body-associated protein FliL